ncbi:restriction endonuclease [bacterium]|nr:restriction endonuclease [bacterium]
MKILRKNYLIRKGEFANSNKAESILEEIDKSILSVNWPVGNNKFTIFPEKKANGVVPIKKSCMEYLEKNGWLLEHRMSLGSRVKPGPVDAVKELSNDCRFALEWETGNISSSHRALNKIAIGLLEKTLAGGVLVLPSRNMYQYLTDRVGNYAEIEPYFPIWQNLDIVEGMLLVIEIEHDSTSKDVPSIKKGTDGRALR